ncbi:hypothetical protein CK203_050716 [Vitis vinifera]|uniref:Uncharacterized protein n=1 Tax=Vitis vinifera TaxID=29760 RepID=A0A438H8V4_VITVI|nr:hypothetical protein CK203_050716 [Vitis vinifera]
MPLSQALRKLTEAGLLAALTPRSPPQPIPHQFRMNLHCAYHQGPGHETDRCIALRHAIQDLIDQGLVYLGQSSVTTNPLPAHTTRVTHPPADGIHFLEFSDRDDYIHMLSWDDTDPEPIMSDGIYEMHGATLGPQMPVSFKFVPEQHRSESRLPPPLRALNVCPLATAIALGYSPSDFGPSTQIVRTYDSTQREVMGTLEIELLIGHHGALYGDMFISAKPVLEISHTDDDLFLTGFTFDEVQTLEIEDFCRNFVAMRCKHGPNEFIAFPDHNVPFRLGFIPIEEHSVKFSEFFPSVRPVGIQFGRFSRFIELAEFKRSNEGCGSHADEGDFGAEGKGTQEAQMLRGNRGCGASSELRAWRKATTSRFLEVIISVHGSYLAEILRFGTGFGTGSTGSAP